MPPYHGKDAVLYASTTGTGVASLVAQLSKISLDMATDKVPTTSFGDANKTYVQGLRDLKGQIEGFWNSAADALFDASESADGCKLYIYPASTAPTIYHYGPAWMDASLDIDVNGAVKFSASFVANGSWGRKP